VLCSPPTKIVSSGIAILWVVFNILLTALSFAKEAKSLALCLPGLAAHAPQSKLDPNGLFTV